MTAAPLKRPAVGLALTWAALLLLDTAAQLSLKEGGLALSNVAAGGAWAAKALSSPWVLGGMACYVGAFFAWMRILRRTDLGKAFPMTAAAYVMMMTASVVVLHERLSGLQWAGAALILAGLAVLGSEA